MRYDGLKITLKQDEYKKQYKIKKSSFTRYSKYQVFLVYGKSYITAPTKINGFNGYYNKYDIEAWIEDGTIRVVEKPKKLNKSFCALCLEIN